MDLIKFVTQIAGKKAWQQQLLAQFGGSEDVGIWNNLETYENYFVYQHLYQNKYWRVKYRSAGGAFASGQNNIVTFAEHVVDLYKAYNPNTTPAVTLSGAWIASAGNDYLGGALYYTNTAGRYAEVTTGAGTSAGCLSVSGGVNRGFALVEIDGSKTAADLLTTAQDLVDSGVIANTCLVANGGTLNPTDRVWDQHGLTQNYNATNTDGGGTYLKWFSNTLSNEPHTIRITVTGYKNISSSGAYVQWVGLVAGGVSSRASQGGNDLLVQVQGADGAGVPEISYSFKPTGATNTAWLGHAGMALLNAVPEVKVNGVVTALTKGISASGDSISITLTNDVRHPETGANNQGAYDITYTFAKDTQLTINHTVTWLTGGTAEGYPCMMTASHAIFDRFKTYGNTEKDLTAGDYSVNLNTRTQSAWCWDFDGYAARLMYINDLESTVDNWVNSTERQLIWSDIATALGWKKAYAYRYSPTKAYLENDVITSECNYRVAWFPGGANVALAGKY